MKKDYRVAICISGHMRSFQKGYESILRNLIIPNKEKVTFDFFIDTWSEKDWRGTDGKENVDKWSDILDTYRPVRVNIQQEKTWDTKPFKPFLKKGHVKKGTNGEHILGMFYKIHSCNQIKSKQEIEESFLYDAVVRARTDIDIKEAIIMNDAFFETVKYTIILAKSFPDGDVPWRSDIFAVSSSSNMNKFAQLYLHLEYLATKFKIFRPESLLQHYINSFMIGVTIRETSARWEVLRDDK